MAEDFATLQSYNNELVRCEFWCGYGQLRRWSQCAVNKKPARAARTGQRRRKWRALNSRLLKL